MDLSKAFDSLDHGIVLCKLRNLGVSKNSIEWFRSYLLKICQSIRIGTHLPDNRTVGHGVPQGSILGPTLFNIYINDLPGIPRVSSVESYVDDSKLYVTFPLKDSNTVMAQLSEDLKNIAAWCCSNSLLINPHKTKLLVFGTRQMLEKVPSNFKASLLLERKILTTIINALAFSRLFYCSCVWGSTSKKNIYKLQKVQKFGACIITSSRKYDHIQPVFKELP